MFIFCCLYFNSVVSYVSNDETNQSNSTLLDWSNTRKKVLPSVMGWCKKDQHDSMLLTPLNFNSQKLLRWLMYGLKNNLSILYPTWCSTNSKAFSLLRIFYRCEQIQNCLTFFNKLLNITTSLFKSSNKFSQSQNNLLVKHILAN